MSDFIGPNPEREQLRKAEAALKSGQEKVQSLLQRVCDENDALRGEVERLKREVHSMNETNAVSVSERIRLRERAENAEAREAKLASALDDRAEAERLRRILTAVENAAREFAPSPGCPVPDDCIECRCRRILGASLRAALYPKEGR